MSDGPSCDLNKPWEAPDEATPKKYPKELPRVAGRSVECSAYLGLVACGKVNGMEFVIMASDRESLRQLWNRVMEGGRELGEPIYRAALLPAQKFEGVEAPAAGDGNG